MSSSTSKPKLVHATTREEWRAWLEEHHATETETRQRRLQQAVGMLERGEKLGITPPPAR